MGCAVVCVGSACVYGVHVYEMCSVCICRGLYRVSRCVDGCVCGVHGSVHTHVQGGQCGCIWGMKVVCVWVCMCVGVHVYEVYGVCMLV